MKTKRCPRCGESKSTKEFGVNAARPDGLNSYCKICANEYGRLLRIHQRQEVLAHYSGGVPKCDCCGETRLEFLSLDHIKGGGKKHIQAIGYTLARHLRQQHYPQGYRVLCHNCNFSIGHYGYCPHKKGSKLESALIEYRTTRGTWGGDRKSKQYRQNRVLR